MSKPPTESLLKTISESAEKNNAISSPKPRRYLKLGLIALAASLVVTAVTIYLYYYAFHEITDDAFTTGHVHSISTRISGTVVEVDADDNESVKKGQILVRLDPRDYTVALDKAQADFDRAQADFDRNGRLLATGAISRQEFDSTKSVWEIAKANLDDAKNQLSYCTITAPTDGVVGNKTVETGNRLSQGTVLMSVVQDIWVIANYKETQVGQMVPLQQVTIQVDEIPGHLFTGHIDSFSPGSGSVFALLPTENATGNYTKIVQRVPVKIVLDASSMKGYEQRLVPGLSVETDTHLVAVSPQDQKGQALASIKNDPDIVH